MNAESDVLCRCCGTNKVPQSSFLNKFLNRVLQYINVCNEKRMAFYLV